MVSAAESYSSDSDKGPGLTSSGIGAWEAGVGMKVDTKELEDGTHRIVVSEKVRMQSTFSASQYKGGGGCSVP